jgi:hypothetical protein
MMMEVTFTSVVSKETELNTSMSPSFAEMVKDPSTAVIVVVELPLTATVTAAIGLSFASFTVPVICLCCACTISIVCRKKKVSKTGSTRKKCNPWLNFRIAVNFKFEIHGC